MRRNSESVGSETYEFKITIFENGAPEELLQFLTNGNKAIKVTGAMTAAVRINFLRTLLRVEALQEFDILASQNNGTTNAHYKKIK